MGDVLGILGAVGGRRGGLLSDDDSARGRGASADDDRGSRQEREQDGDED